MSAADFHSLAKEAGNALKSYILAYASGATGVFFLALSDSDPADYTLFQKVCLVGALVFFVATVATCLYELHIDARRFFNIAKQLERPKSEQEWNLNERYKSLRVKLLYGSYVAVGLASVLAVAFLVARVT